MTGARAFAGLAAALAVAVALLVACGQQDSAPARPAGVPSDAFWIGGADGGAYIVLAPRAGGRRFDASVFHENGDLWYRGPLELEPADAEPIDAGRADLFEGWDGEALYVQGGRALRAPDAP